MHTLSKKENYQVLGLDISSYSKEEFFMLIEERLKDDEPSSPPLFVVTVNPEIAIRSIIDYDYKKILQRSSINTADGVGISWAVKYLYKKQVDRITGSDSTERISNIAAEQGQSIFLYGAAPGIAQKAGSILQDRIQGLHVAGSFSPDQPDIPVNELPKDIKEQMLRAQVVFVALGAPSQEKWIHQNLASLPNCKLIIGIGGTFDFITGNIKRAPVFFRKTGLEWLYRLYLQPSRWRRMLNLPLFAINILFLRSSFPVNNKEASSK